MTRLRVYLDGEPPSLGDPGWAGHCRQRHDKPSWWTSPRLDREPGEREFDPASGCWVRVSREIPDIPTPRPAPRPFRDGSNKFWLVVDRKTDHVLWRIEAGSFHAALGEKKRLCRAAGFRSGDAFLTRV
jgi:hypothetical protein